MEAIGGEKLRRMVTDILIPELVHHDLKKAREVALRVLGAVDVKPEDADHLFWSSVEALARKEQETNGLH